MPCFMIPYRINTFQSKLIDHRKEKGNTKRAIVKLSKGTKQIDLVR